MGYGPRVLNATGPNAEGDKSFSEFVYNDTSGSLTIGMPVYADVTDAAEWNANNATTKLTPAVGATGGNVVLGANANAGANITCVGVFQPSSPNSKPNKGDVIRVQTFGRAIVSAAAKAAGTAVTVGAKLIADASQDSCLAGAAVVDKTIATALATGAAVAAGASIIAVPGGGTTTALVNAFVKLA